MLGVFIKDQAGSLNDWLYRVTTDILNDRPRFIYSNGNVESILEYANGWKLTIDLDTSDSSAPITYICTKHGKNPPLNEWITFSDTSAGGRRRLSQTQEFFITPLLTEFPTPSPSDKPTRKPTAPPSQAAAGGVGNDSPTNLPTKPPTNGGSGKTDDNGGSARKGIIGSDPLLDYLLYIVIGLVVIILCLCCIMVCTRKKHKREKAKAETHAVDVMRVGSVSSVGSFRSMEDTKPTHEEFGEMKPVLHTNNPSANSVDTSPQSVPSSVQINMGQDVMRAKSMPMGNMGMMNPNISPVMMGMNVNMANMGSMPINGMNGMMMNGYGNPMHTSQLPSPPARTVCGVMMSQNGQNGNMEGAYTMNNGMNNTNVMANLQTNTITPQTSGAVMMGNYTTTPNGNHQEQDSRANIEMGKVENANNVQLQHADSTDSEDDDGYATHTEESESRGDDMYRQGARDHGGSTVR